MKSGERAAVPAAVYDSALYELKVGSDDAPMTPEPVPGTRITNRRALRRRRRAFRAAKLSRRRNR